VVKLAFYATFMRKSSIIHLLYREDRRSCCRAWKIFYANEGFRVFCASVLKIN